MSELLMSMNHARDTDVYSRQDDTPLSICAEIKLRRRALFSRDT